jgi:hypothetical protein
MFIDDILALQTFSFFIEIGNIYSPLMHLPLSIVVSIFYP